MSRSPESSSTTPDTAVKAEGFEVAGAIEFGQEQPRQTAESRVGNVLRSIAEGAYKVGDKLHDFADKRESRADSKASDQETQTGNKQERESSKETAKAIFRGFGRNARKAMISTRVGLAVGKANIEDTFDAAKDKFDTFIGAAQDKYTSVKDRATELGDAAKDKLDAAKKSVNSFGAPKRNPNDISDIINVSERKSDPTKKVYRRENGKFMSQAQVDLIRAHQDQIREGMRELNGTKEPNIVDNLKQNVTERTESVRSSVESFLFNIADRIRERKDKIKASLLETFTARKADVISEYRAAKEVITGRLDKVEGAIDNKADQIKQYFADRKSEAEARKAARVESREQARAKRARNREIDSRIVSAETARRLENRESRRTDPAEARRRGSIATRAAAIAAGIRVGAKVGARTYNRLK